ncbi:MAG TPA: hypothetical protein VGE23_02695 [Candidatus Paceibacterota bacterium]
MQKDLFESVPEFLAAFNNILENGFFEQVEFAARGEGMEGKVHSCSVIAAGCVPDHKRYQADGCGLIVDPGTVIAAVRKLAGQEKVMDVSTKVETNDWPLWDTEGENIIGSKGKRTKLSLYITFKT